MAVCEMEESLALLIIAESRDETKYIRQKL